MFTPVPTLEPEQLLVLDWVLSVYEPPAVGSLGFTCLLSFLSGGFLLSVVVVLFCVVEVFNPDLLHSSISLTRLPDRFHCSFSRTRWHQKSFGFSLDDCRNMTNAAASLLCHCLWFISFYYFILNIHHDPISFNEFSASSNLFQNPTGVSHKTKTETFHFFVAVKFHIFPVKPVYFMSFVFTRLTSSLQAAVEPLFSLPNVTEAENRSHIRFLLDFYREAERLSGSPAVCRRPCFIRNRTCLERIVLTCTDATCFLCLQHVYMRPLYIFTRTLHCSSSSFTALHIAEQRKTKYILWECA